MKKIIIVVVVLAVIGLVGWNLNKTSPTTGSKNTIKIGAILSETGVASSFGEMAHKGIELAAKEINANGGIEGRMVEIVYEDDRTDPKTAAGAYQKLVGIDHVDGIIGSNFDFVSQPIFALAKTGDTVVVSPSNPRIAGSFDTNSHAFVMMTDFDNVIRGLTDYLKTTKYQQLGILRFESAFAEQEEKTLNDIQKELGKKPIVSETYKQIGNNDYKTQILKMKKAGVDLIFLDMVATDPITFINQAKQLDYHPMIVTHDGIKDSLNVKDAPIKDFENAVVLTWNVAPESFEKKFTDAYGVVQDNSANRAYEAVYVIAQAKAKAKTKAEIPSIMESTKFITPNGEFFFNKDHAAASTPVSIKIVKNGKLVPLAN
jgi:branched-chain amino acid transport system substrate-binding protein